MKIFHFEQDQVLARSLDEVFEFFGDARKLQLITPSWLSFSILTPGPIEMRPGAVIDYRLRIYGYSLRWRSEITVWEPPRRFVDVQLRGPYRLWEHSHEFEAIPGGTRVRDQVRYAVPGCRLINRLFVARSIAKIFKYRRQVLTEIFGKGAELP